MSTSDEVAGAPSDNTTLLDVLRRFAADGYGGDMVVTEDALLRCANCRRELAPADVRVAALRRLEGASDPADMMAVVAVVCPHCDNHATIVLAYGPEASSVDADVLLALDT